MALESRNPIKARALMGACDGSSQERPGSISARMLLPRALGSAWEGPDPSWMAPGKGLIPLGRA